MSEEKYTYIQAIGIGFPLCQCHAIGDGSVYGNLIWDEGSPIPSQETLDSWILGNPVSAAAGIKGPAPGAFTLTLSLTADTTFTATNTVCTLLATLSDGAGNTLPISESFHVPVINEAGQTVLVKQVNFVDGVATIEISFKSSGYYRINETCINDRLVGMYIYLPNQFELTVYEP